jgi:hypothetical protein
MTLSKNKEKTEMRRIVLSITMGAMLLGTATASFADEKEGKVARRQERQQHRP